MSNFEPVRAEPAPDSYRRRDWTQYTDGQWWKFRDDPDASYAVNTRENDRIRVAAHQWGGRHGWQVESRTERRGGRLFLRFRPTGC